jgi:hypothetical protein
MNIFILDHSPESDGKMHCNIHCIKMICENAQMLSTAHRVLDGHSEVILSQNKRSLKYYRLNDSREQTLYKATHVNHPSNIWTRECLANYQWHYRLFVALCDQYTLRYGKTHATDTRLRDVLKSPPDNIDPSTQLTPFRLAINVPECILDDPIQSYRLFYQTKQDSTCNGQKYNNPSGLKGER